MRCGLFCCQVRVLRGCEVDGMSEGSFDFIDGYVWCSEVIAVGEGFYQAFAEPEWDLWSGFVFDENVEEFVQEEILSASLFVQDGGGLQVDIFSSCRGENPSWLIGGLAKELCGWHCVDGGPKRCIYGKERVCFGPCGVCLIEK
jgi:hypothetical protein